MSDKDKPVSVPTENGGIERFTQASGALRHRIKYRLDVSR